MSTKLRSFSVCCPTHGDNILSYITQEIRSWLEANQEIEIITASHSSEIVSKTLTRVTALIFYKEN